MHAIRALIYKHGNWRVRARIRNMLGHFLHDERIANNEANHLRSLAARFFAQNRAVIQWSHQSVTESRLAEGKVVHAVDLFSSPVIFVNSKRPKWPCV